MYAHPLSFIAMGEIRSTLLALCVACGAHGQIIIAGPKIGLGPTSTHGLTIPIGGWYTWESAVSMWGNGWSPNEHLVVHLKGPQNTLGVAATDRILGDAYTDAHGIISSFAQYGFLSYGLVIPFNEVTPSPATDDTKVPEPGYYILEVDGPNVYHNPIEVLPPDSASVPINVGPDGISTPTSDPYTFTGWPRDRGARMGFLGSIAPSPEIADPEWLSIWNDKPVAMYATIAPSTADPTIADPPLNQPAFIAHADLPFTHYGHDVNMELVPDPEYLWLLGSANFWSETRPGMANYGRMECEWETQNNGLPVEGSYGQGNIGMPLFVMPSEGDRVYMVGRWVFDNGHPDGGDRSEIHPVRMLATMRQRATATPFLATAAMTKAKQVDVYVSGHGGGANMYPDGLSETNDWRGGGGMLQDAIDQYAMAVYFGFGPANSDLWHLLVDILNIANGTNLSVLQAAGPSGLGWGPGPEFRPVNDMDYAFDVPLPQAPAGATKPEYNVTVQPGNTTQVKEYVSYTNYVNGIPTMAHIILPYYGSDNGIFAKTFKFYWNVYQQPGMHFKVQINDAITTRSNNGLGDFNGPGPLYMWADVCGQWTNLIDANPSLGQFHSYSSVGSDQFNFTDTSTTHSLKFDVYLDSTDTMRVFAHGYAARDFDKLFGVDVGKPAYDAGVDLAKAQVFGNGENQNLGGALYEQPVATTSEVQGILGPQHLVRQNTNQVNDVTGWPCAGPVFSTDFTVSYVPRPPAISEGGLPMNFGTVVHGKYLAKTFRVANTGETPLSVTGITVAGAGFVPSSYGPFTLAPNTEKALTLYFAPASAGSFTGTVTIKSNDSLHPTLTYKVSGTGS